VALRKKVLGDLVAELELRRMFAAGWDIGVKQGTRKPKRKAERAAWERFSAAIARRAVDHDSSVGHDAGD